MSLDKLVNELSHMEEKKTVAVAEATNEETLKAVKDGIIMNLANFKLFGNMEDIRKTASDIDLDLDDSRITLHHATSLQHAVEKAVASVSEERSDVLMKGDVATKILLKAVLKEGSGLRNGRILSHVAMFEIPGRDKLLFLTDAGMNISPGLEEKVQIIQNAVDVTNRLGIEEPKVAPLAAVEIVNPAMQASVDAAVLSQMQKRGQITNCLVDGPLAFDNAISLDSKKHKKIQSDVAGDADILVCPYIEVGNTLYKAFTYFADAKVAGIISGAKAPIVLTSRADTAESKIYSLAFALLTS
ncbi:phosphate butyryltransferase [Halalkalibacillus sediminis]|uniref:Phosphate butyryltransferase n=1 Tax=Halalkalibacillus sediminis TaxID=2018042 RepID=A0A2I0QX98_9BACI|nr:bifunctional enoyl-CoA hydratase/phosphate acetyltransferase [Halalkalibacillus sediminis]PKR78939.1 phosphate butyryltransferase [Halalkalibacillus sediminis]